MATPDPPKDRRAEDAQPTKAELEADASIDADFDQVMHAVIDGHGTKSTPPQA